MTDTLLRFVPYSAFLSLADAPHQWNINYLGKHDDALHIVGWCLPVGGVLDNSVLVLNGRRFPLQLGAYEEVYARLYPWYPNAAFSSFSLSISESTIRLNNTRDIEIHIESTAGTRPAYSPTLHLRLDDLSFELPPSMIAKRIGVEHPLHYVMFGRAIYCELRKALTVLGLDIGTFQRILDWGSGSGRVGRHFISDLTLQQSYLGVDIDEEAINWSRSHYGNYFEVCGQMPPLRLLDRSVDLIFAYSVVTHLRREVLAAWIDELRRLIVPGGIFAFTVLGETAQICLNPNKRPNEIEDWLREGISDSTGNSQLDDLTEDYYKNVWLTEKYIRHMLYDFEILKYQPGFHFYQDLVVAKKL